MSQALEPEDRFESALHADAGVGLGSVSLKAVGTDLASTQDKSIWAAVDGEIYDAADLWRSLGETGRSDVPGSRAELVARLYQRDGVAFAGALNGAFTIAIWDGRTRTLLVVNDRLGLAPLYYSLAGGDCVFASGVRAVLADAAVDRSIDRIAINEFLVYDHVLGDRTFLNAVKLLPQGSALTFRDGQLRIQPYWTLRYPDIYTPQPEAAYVEQLMHCLRRSMARQEPRGAGAAVLLSGGLDSRFILGLLEERGATLETVTFGIPGCDDARVAAEVAAATGARHQFLELKPDWLLKHSAKAVHATDGLGNIVNQHVLAPLETLARDGQILYKGFFGDALLGFALKRQMWGDYDAATRYHVHMGVHNEQGVVNYDRAAQGRLLTEEFQSAVGSAVCREYAEGMERAGVTQLANQRLYFDLTQRVPRMTLNGVQAARQRGIVRLPFCDNDLLDFALTVPPGFLFERYLPKAALMRHYPKLARIPMAGTGRPLISCARDVAVQAKNLASWHLRKAGLGWLAARERRPYKDYDKWFRTTLRSWMEDTLLDPRALQRGYFKPDAVKQLIAEHHAGTNHAVRLGALLTIELWHRQYLD